MKRFFGCVLILFLVAGAGLFGVWRARQPPAVGDKVPFTKLPAPEQKRRREDVRVLESQIKEIKRDAEQGRKERFDVDITNDQLNTVLQDRIDTSKFPIRNLRAGIEPNRLLVQGDLKYQGIEGAVTLIGNITVENNQLKFVAESLQFGMISAPSKWKAQLETQVSKNLNEALSKAPGRIEKVTLGEGRMTVSGVTD